MSKHRRCFNYSVIFHSLTGGYAQLLFFSYNRWKVIFFNNWDPVFLNFNVKNITFLGHFLILIHVVIAWKTMLPLLASRLVKYCTIFSSLAAPNWLSMKLFQYHSNFSTFNIFPPKHRLVKTPVIFLQLNCHLKSFFEIHRCTEIQLYFSVLTSLP